MALVRDPSLARADGLGSPALRVYTPPGYDDPAQRDARYPVLYLHDGQNVFDRGGSRARSTWGADATLDSLVAQGLIEPHIAVAIDHREEHRIADYSPWPDARLRFEPRGATSAAYLCDQVVPFVDGRYRTRASAEHRALAGSSLGGLMALYAGFARRDLFSRIGALSPSVMWCERQLFTLWSRRPTETAAEGPARIYLDVGSREFFVAGHVELEYGTDVRDFHSHLESLGYGPDEVRFVLDPRGVHDERSWRRRLPAALRWLLAG